MQEEDIPAGYCQCGCGEKTKISPTLDRARGYVKGQPRRYVNPGHAWRGRKRAAGPDYVVDPDTGCWVWQHGTTRKGYGQKVLQPGNRVVVAHRWYYEQARGPIPEGKYIDHLCRNTRCVNPEHLEIVTNAVNVRRGESTKLTPNQIAEIRAAPHGYGTGRPLAIKFGVSDSTVSSIRNYQSWVAE